MEGKRHVGSAISEKEQLEEVVFTSLADPISSTCISRTAIARSDASEHKNASGDSASKRRSKPGMQSGLSSTVQESPDICDIEGQRHELLEAITPDTLKRIHMMNSQGDLTNGTQVLSQSIYEVILKKRRSTDGEVAEQPTESQRTYEEGDTGHVDIVSSFVTGRETTNDANFSEPLEISPVRTQTQLTQFPESQRFKTPATKGKKRTYNGDIVETPAQQRNPLLRDRQPTPSRMFGLSQAFANTQAVSSPLSNGMPTGPRSDRPSPDVDLLVRPSTTSSSSPLRPISELMRTSTDPASRYVSMKHSQAERQLQGQSIFSPDMAVQEALFDDFEDEPSLLIRKRRQKEREEKAKTEMRSLSSPLRSNNDQGVNPVEDRLLGHPFPKPSNQTPVSALTEPCKSSVSDYADTMDVSEAETEQEERVVDVSQVDVRRSSQPPKDDEEDKENRSVLVPKTVPRSMDFRMAISDINDSPSIRNMVIETEDSEADLYSSEPFRIMDSQPFQSRTKFADSLKPTTSTESEIIDFGDEAGIMSRPKPEEPLSSPMSKVGNRHLSLPFPQSDDLDDDEEEKQSVLSCSNDSRLMDAQTLEKSIPETSSDGRLGAQKSLSVLDTEKNSSRHERSFESSKFETARTYPGSGTKIRSPQASSPIHNTPPGRRRRRMLEISAEASPQKLQSQPSFDAAVVLQLDADQDIAGLLQTTSRNRPLSPQKTEKHLLTSRHHSGHLHDPAPIEERPKISPREEHEIIDGPQEQSQAIVRPERLGLSNRLRSQKQAHESGAALSPPRSRKSIFDIQASPDQTSSVQHGRSSMEVSETNGRARRPRRLVHSASKMEKRLLTAEGSPRGSAAEIATPKTVTGVEPHLTRSAEIESLPHNDNCDVDTVQEEATAMTVVFAYYRGNPRGYYPAKFLGLTESNGYRVQWDGYEPDEVGLGDVKTLDVRVGDTVKVLAKGFTRAPFTVLGFKDQVIDGPKDTTQLPIYKTIVLTAKQKKSFPIATDVQARYEVPVTSIYLDANLWAQMWSRNEGSRSAIRTIYPSGLLTPFDRDMTPSTPSSRNRRQTETMTRHASQIPTGMFVDMAFAVSYDDNAQKNALCDLVRSHGGVLLEDSFHDLVDLDSLQLKTQHVGLHFAALLTDRHSRKEKYMQALALGLPCLSGKWIHACANQNALINWEPYLLPAGESAELDNATRSRTLPFDSTNKVKVSVMLDVRPKFLEQAAVIVVVGRGKMEAKRMPYLFLIKALGAQEIHKVPDIRSAHDLLKSEEGKMCTWAFVEDKEVNALQNQLSITNDRTIKGKSGNHERTEESRAGCRVAGNELIVQSLILGKLYQS